jgi:uncharacterized protein YktA (UPF0223 family)
MTKKISTATKVAGGLGLAALAAGAAATYYFSGPEGKKHQKIVKGWAKKAQAELVSKMKQMETVSKKGYEQATSEVLEKYKQVKNIDPAELNALGKELKGHWDNISKSLVKAANKTVKKVAPKAKAKK